VANSEERLRSVLANLEGCRAALGDSGAVETAQIVSLAILQLRQKLNSVSDAELRAICDAMAREQRAAERPHDPNSPQGPRGPGAAALKLVK
jgi:hypothetical protein